MSLVILRVNLELIWPFRSLHRIWLNPCFWASAYVFFVDSQILFSVCWHYVYCTIVCPFLLFLLLFCYFFFFYLWFLLFLLPLPASRLLSEEGGRRWGGEGGEGGWGGDVSPCPWVRHGALHPRAAIPPPASRGTSKPQKEKTIGKRAGRGDVFRPTVKAPAAVDKDTQGGSWRVGLEFSGYICQIRLFCFTITKKRG